MVEFLSCMTSQTYVGLLYYSIDEKRNKISEFFNEILILDNELQKEK